jgi:hypothetical protein
MGVLFVFQRSGPCSTKAQDHSFLVSMMCAVALAFMAFLAFIIWHLSIQHLRAKPALWFKAVALGAAGPYNSCSRLYLTQIG